MTDPEFPTPEIRDQLHPNSRTLSGGRAGVREPNLIDSAPAAARNTSRYGHGDLDDLAACFPAPLVESPTDLDGNRRPAVAAAGTFLKGNGVFRRIEELAL